jgi:hypothetical protein
VLLVADVLRQVRPSVLVLNAGATHAMAPLDKQTWESSAGTGTPMSRQPFGPR